MKNRSVIKRRFFRVVSVAIFLVVGILASAYMSDELELGWYSVDGGGGVCSSDDLSLVCSIGQPDAGVMAGGGYTLESGFLVGGFSDDGLPDITVSLSSDVLWPPNHKMVAVWPDVTVSDDNDPDPLYWLEQITVVERDMSSVYYAATGEMTGDADLDGDIEVDSDGQIYLRAERSGKSKEGRVYTIIYKVSDAAGNESLGSVDITVPHDMSTKSGGKKPKGK